MNKRILFWLPAIAWAAGIFLLSAMSNPPQPGPVFPMRDKLAHWMLYLILGFLTARALRHGHNYSLPKSILLAATLSSLYGITDELHQQLVPYRTCDIADWLADTLGACTAAAAYYAYETHRSAKANR